MLVRDRVAATSDATPGAAQATAASLPTSLKTARVSVRTALFRRLSASRSFALGDRAGALSAAQRRSGRAFRLDVRQRVIVKVLIARHLGRGAARAGALARHLSYLGRGGAGLEGAPPDFFDRTSDHVSAREAVAGWSDDRHHFRLIVSPEHGDRISDLRDYVRETMERVSEDLGEPGLVWLATCHFDTDQPHAHVLIRGKRSDGRDLVIPRDYIAYGIRARAQEVAQERLGDLSRAEAERRVWRETEADRFTGLDRRLLAAASRDGAVADGVGGSDAWAALTRGRLRHLERLGLATRRGATLVLVADLEPRLRQLQTRRDIIRTLNQRRLETGASVAEVAAESVRGRVVKSGFHDELGASPFVIVRSADGSEHYVRLRSGQTPPTMQSSIQLNITPRGATVGAERAGFGLGAQDPSH